MPSVTLNSLDWKHQMESVQGKRILLTGGTTGIGRATAILLASHGARIYTYGETRQELDDALRDIEKAADKGGEVFGAVIEQTRHDEVLRAFEEADARLGGIDILVSNAAQPATGVTKMDFEQIEFVVRTNLLGYIACVQEAVRRFQEQGKGYVVCVGSMSADVKDTGADVYTATKTGIAGFCDALRKQVNEQNIKVSLVEPGLVGTDLHEDEQAEPEKQREMQAQLEMLTAEDIAAAILFCIQQPWRSEIVTLEIKPSKQII